jgi:hypothetical protein
MVRERQRSALCMELCSFYTSEVTAIAINPTDTRGVNKDFEIPLIPECEFKSVVGPLSAPSVTWCHKMMRTPQGPHNFRAAALAISAAVAHACFEIARVHCCCITPLGSPRPLRGLLITIAQAQIDSKPVNAFAFLSCTPISEPFARQLLLLRFGMRISLRGAPPSLRSTYRNTRLP